MERKNFFTDINVLIWAFTPNGTSEFFIVEYYISYRGTGENNFCLHPALKAADAAEKNPTTNRWH